MYSFKNQYPTETLPDRIRLSSGDTRTGGTYSEEELVDAGYKLVDAMPEINNTQKVLWNYITGEWHVIDKSADDIREETAIAWAQIRQRRNHLLAASDWTQNSDYPGQYALAEQRILKQKYAQYRKQLRDITYTYANPSEVVWPTEPTLADAQVTIN